MFNALCYHYKMSHQEVGKLTLHQFNTKVEFLNKMFSDKPDKADTSASNPVNRGILDKTFGVK